MFTGLVEETGEVVGVERKGGGAMRLRVRASVVTQGLREGDSICVSGCCLTATGCEDGALSFDLLAETTDKTSFGGLQVGSKVNLERSLAVGDRMGGHFVTGHVDTTGTVRSLEREGADWILRIDVPPRFRHYLVYKGSIAIEGVSLTVAAVEPGGLHVALIPHTLEVTNLRDLRPGSKVNLEFDMLAKYVERMLEGRSH